MFRGGPQARVAAQTEVTLMLHQSNYIHLEVYLIPQFVLLFNLIIISTLSIIVATYGHELQHSTPQQSIFVAHLYRNVHPLQ